MHESNHIGVAKLETKFYLMANSCLEFYYRFIGEGESTIKVTFGMPEIDIGEKSGSEKSEDGWNR